MIILKCIIRIESVRILIGTTASEHSSVAGCCEHDDEPSAYKKRT
jgi:hypothetical protein